MADYINSSDLEQQWAMKAFDHAELYENLVTSVNPRNLKLSMIDDHIYRRLKEVFPDFNVETLEEEQLKSPAAKKMWRIFCEEFKTLLDDYNDGVLIRQTCSGPFSQENSILVVRIQFLAIEIARNREGYNDNARKMYKAASET